MGKCTEVKDRTYDVEFATKMVMNGVPEEREVIVMKRCAGTEYGGSFEADEFLKTLGLDVRDGDEVVISAKVTQRVFKERRPPRKDDV